jgi:uncharacterized protein YjdB
MSTDVTRSLPAACSPCTDVTGLTLANAGSLSIKTSESVALMPQVAPATASNQNVTWKSSNVKVASVDQNGLVTGNNIGSATITATTSSGAKTASASVTVSALVPTKVAVVGLPKPLYIGASKQLSASVTPIHVKNHKVTWSTANAAIATVSSTGEVKGITAGNVIISATAVDGGLVGSATIEVKSKAVTGFNVSPASTLLPKNDSIQIQTGFTPSDASNQSVTWVSSNPAIATVSTTGLVKGIAGGTVTITGTSNGNTSLKGQVTIDVIDVNTALTYIEAENFTQTGGAFAGFTKNLTLGNINDNQTGDWVEFAIDVNQAGIYQLVMATGSPMDGAGVEFSVDGISNGRAAIPNNGNWDQHVTNVVTNGLQINGTGPHILRLTSVGAGGAYQWNLDKIGYRLLKATNGGASSVASSMAPSSVAKSSGAPSSVAKSSVAPSSVPKSSVAPSSVPKSSVAPSSVAKSSVAASSVASSTANGGGTGVKVTVQAENFSATGGTYQGFQKYTTANGIGAINYNQRGDLQH